MTTLFQGTNSRTTLDFNIVTSSLQTLQFLLPMIPTIGSAFISIYVLKSSEKSLIRCERMTRNKRYAATTIVLITVAYALYNLPFCMYFTLLSLDLHLAHKPSMLSFDHNGHYFSNFVIIISMGMRSTTTAVLYLWRFRGMRVYFISSVVGSHIRKHRATVAVGPLYPGNTAALPPLFSNR